MSPQQLNRLREISELCEQGRASHQDIKQLTDILTSLHLPKALQRTAKLPDTHSFEKPV